MLRRIDIDSNSDQNKQMHMVTFLSAHMVEEIFSPIETQTFIMKTSLFKYIENFHLQKLKNFR